MSIKDRLEKKTARIVEAARAGSVESTNAPEIDSKTIRQSKPEARVPRTGPGQMLAFRSHMQESNTRIDELESALSRFDGSLPVQKLDPESVMPSKWANRHSTSFLSAQFLELKRDIETAGGNVQPILVRPLVGEKNKFEIVFGHRRHQACLQLGLPILALIESVTDKELFAAMDRENRARADLSPYEQGEMYRKALDDGLFPSLRMLASEVGADPGNVSKAITIARLPTDVLSAFSSPSQIQFRWGSALSKAIEKDADGVLERARVLAARTQKPTPNEVFDTLTGQVRKLRATTVDLRKNGKALGRIKRSTDGSVLVSLKPGVIDDADFQRLRDGLESIVLK